MKKNAAVAKSCKNDLFILCTHSKSGCTWIASVILIVAEFLGKKVVINDHKKIKPDTWLLWHDHSEIDFHFLKQKWPNRKLHTLHIPRNPKDVLFAGLEFNLNNSVEWNSKKNFLKGKSYRECLLALPDQDSKINFEYQYVTKPILEEMRSWQPMGHRNLELKYENFGKVEASFDRIWKYLKLSRSEQKIAVAVMNSAQFQLTNHIKDKTSKTVRVFERPSTKKTLRTEMNKLLLKEHFDVFIRYGYIDK